MRDKQRMGRKGKYEPDCKRTGEGKGRRFHNKNKRADYGDSLGLDATQQGKILDHIRQNR